MIKPVPQILDDLRQGKMVIVVDDDKRENEGDLLCAAEFVTPQIINFMICHAKGLVCLAIEESQRLKLGLQAMSSNNKSSFQTNFTQSIEASYGISTGISPFDRAKTIKAAINPSAKYTDIVTPGHVFPVVAQKGGLFERDGHTEAAVDLSKMAGLNPSGVICEIINLDGSMARMPDLQKYAITHQLNIASIASIIEFRAEHEALINYIGYKQVQNDLLQSKGRIELHTFEDRFSLKTHHALLHISNDKKLDPCLATAICVFKHPLSIIDLLCNNDYKDLLKEFLAAEQCAFLFISSSKEKLSVKDYCVARQILMNLKVGETRYLTGPNLLAISNQN